MCNCVEVIQNGVDRWPSAEGEPPVESLELVEVGLKFRAGGRILQAFTYSTVIVKRDGRKRAEKAKLFHYYCPFCGDHTEREEPEDQSQRNAS